MSCSGATPTGGRVVGQCAGGFEGARAAGLLRPGIDPGTAGRAFVALMDGLQLQWLLDRDSVDMAAVLRELLAECLVAGAYPSPGMDSIATTW